MSAASAVAIGVLVLFVAVAARGLLGKAPLPDYPRWFAPATIFAFGATPLLTVYLEPPSDAEAQRAGRLVGWVAAALFTLLAAWRLRARQRAIPLRKVGVWERPSRLEGMLFLIPLLLVGLADAVTKAMFYTVPPQAYSAASVSVCSTFHDSPNTPSHAVTLVTCVFVVGLSGVFFRYERAWLARTWRVFAGAWLGASAALVLERAATGGVHNVFCLKGPVQWVCPPCALLHPSGYALCLADVFVTWPLFVGLVLFLMAYLGARSTPRSAGAEADEARPAD